MSDHQGTVTSFVILRCSAQDQAVENEPRARTSPHQENRFGFCDAVLARTVFFMVRYGTIQEAH